MVENNQGEYGKYIVQELHDPGMGSPEFQAMYKKFSKRILWIDGKQVPGSVQMNTAWYYAVPEKDPVFEEHTHDGAELIGFFGSDPEHPYDLNADLEVTINGEVHHITKTSLIFIPEGLPHMPLRILRVDKPIFHFSVSIEPEYNGGAYQ